MGLFDESESSSTIESSPLTEDTASTALAEPFGATRTTPISARTRRESPQASGDSPPPPRRTNATRSSSPESGDAGRAQRAVYLGQGLPARESRVATAPSESSRLEASISAVSAVLARPEVLQPGLGAGSATTTCLNAPARPGSRLSAPQSGADAAPTAAGHGQSLAQPCVRSDPREATMTPLPRP